MFRTRVQQRANQVWLHNVTKVKNISKNMVMNMRKEEEEDRMMEVAM
jgi:hypothetical protein